MEVKIKKLSEDAKIPCYAKEGDAGLDFTATSVSYDSESDCIIYGTGLAVEIPRGYVGLLFPRSSIANKEILLTNCVGVIDSGYRGEIMFKFKTYLDYCSTVLDIDGKQMRPLEEGLFEIFQTADDQLKELYSSVNIYAIGDRVGQMIILPYPEITFVESKELSESERGEGGYGHTGN